MPKVTTRTNRLMRGGVEVVEVRKIFECPCGGHHQEIPVTGPAAWGYNGNDDAPTFTPSIRTRYGREQLCHSFVRNGRIQFLGDCTHELAGQTVDLAEVEE